MALVSPYAAHRRRARAIHERDGLAFVEVWMNTPLQECERRDPKGLYSRARQGELEDLTGVDDPYEAPERPEVELRPDSDGGLAAVLDALRDRGVLDAHQSASE